MSFYVEKVKRKKGGRYRIVKDLTINGRRRRSYYTLPGGTSKTVAEKICLKMALEYEYGDYIPKEAMMFEEYVEQIYFPKYTIYLSATTQQHYKQMYNAKDGIKEHIGNLFLSEISTEVLQDMVNHYSASKAPKTIR